MNARAGSQRLVSAAALGLVAVTVLLWAATGNLAVALGPMLAVLLGWALLEAPPHRIALALFFLAIVTDNPKEHPAQDRWISPLKPLGVLLYENLNTITGVQALRFCLMDLLLAALFVVAIVRERRRDWVSPPEVLHTFAAVAWLAVVWIEVWGIARGGDFKASLWQARQIFWTPVVVYLFAALLRGPADHPAIGKAIVAAAVVKALFGAYYYAVVCRPLGIVPDYATTHSDTVLFVSAAAVAAAVWLERRTPGAALASLAILAVVGLGIVVNGRRLAYVGLAGMVAMLRFVLPPDGLRRTFDRALLASIPAGVVYLAVGWRSSAAVFGPARKVASLLTGGDNSSAMRDIENYNLITTWKQHLILGSGFGHEYTEQVHAVSIESIFPLYRYIGHNGVLWFASAGGLVGFTAFWMLIVGMAYFAARSYRFAVRPIDRAAALSALSVATTVGVQAYGDMGLNSWTSVFALAMAAAVASKLAVASGAYPGPHAAPSSLAAPASPRVARAPAAADPGGDCPPAQAARSSIPGGEPCSL